MFTGKRTADNQLLKLNEAIQHCDTCALHASKGLGYGNPQARLLILGMNTGLKIQGENKELVPFGLHDPDPTGKGKSADVLREILWDCNIKPGDYYVTNAMKCQVKKPEEYMITNCTTWLHNELNNMPSIMLIIATGAVAAKVVDAELGRLGTWTYENLQHDRKYFVTRVAHPAFVLYPGGVSKDEYRKQWEFVAAVVARLDSEPTKRILGRTGD
jgi:uracil-DNA glycosylase family 4